jgi:hypothetical protein
MDKIIVEASPFIDVKHSDESAKKELYNLPFEVSRIANKQGASIPKKMYGFWESDSAFADRLEKWNDEEKKVLFEGWSCKDMYHFQEIYDIKTNTIITFESNEYEVNYSGRKFLFPLLPDTIDDFINDLKRIGIKLFWKPEIADIYGIENVTSNKKIIDYYGILKEFNDKQQDFNNGSST